MGTDDCYTYTEKIPKPACSSMSTKHGAAFEVSNPNAGLDKKLCDNVLFKHQGQKWQQVFDFDKIIKQLRVAERQLKNKKCEYFGTNNVCQGCNPENARAAESSPKRRRAIKQVQRLDSKDMHFYGIVGNKTMLDIVVCNVCSGSYTKMGFNNHMMLQHPSAWSSVSNKVTLSDHGAEHVRDMSRAETTSSPSQMFAAAAPSSVAPAPPSADTSATIATSARHKSKKGSSKTGSSSSSGGRSRSKSKHHSSSHNKHSSSESKTNSEAGSKKSTKTSKKGSATAAGTASSVVGTNSKDSKAGAATCTAMEPPQPTTTHSSFSLPTTPKKTHSAPADVSIASILAEKTNNVKEKLCAEKVSVASIIASKKKVKGSVYTGQEPHESAAASGSSSGAYERVSSGGTSKSNKSSSGSSGKSSSGKVASTVASKKSKCEQKRQNIESQMSELDQAVSSIMGGKEIKTESCGDDDASGGSLGRSVAVGAYRKPPLLVEVKKEKVPSLAPMATSAVKTEVVAPNGLHPSKPAAVLQNTAVNNTILSFEDMLDNKFISEILGNADTEIHYSNDTVLERDSERACQQSYQQQPLTKRMRYNPGTNTAIQQQPMELSGEFTVFQQPQQQQQQQQHEQHFANYTEASSMEDIKLFNSQQPPDNLEAHYHTQLQQAEQQAQSQPQPQILHRPEQLTLDASQLQQLLYEPDNLNAYNAGGTVVQANEATHQQQVQFNPTDFCEPEKPKNLDMCAPTDDVKLAEYATLTTINNPYSMGDSMGGTIMESEFQLFNVPSITDDAAAITQDLFVNNMPLRCAPQQYVLPQSSDEQQLIYEITANNQVAVLSQDRQQQVITELLNQAGYENVEYMNIASTDETSEWFDFDFSHIETMKAFTSNSGSGNVAPSAKAVRSEYSNLTPLKFHDDFYLNVFIYNRIPRPLAINTFGLVKLPWATSATFRKQVLTSRKANNSPVTLGGGMHGVGGNTAAVTSRFNNLNPKPTQSYFTALSAGSSNGALANEFSIGSITITNSPSTSQTQPPAFSYHRQQSLPNGHIEISFNTNTNGPSVVAPVSNTGPGRARPRVAGVAQNNVGNNIATNRSVFGASTSTGTIRSTTHPRNVKTIYVSNAANVVKNRDNVVKRNLIAKVNVPTKTYFTPKQLSNFLIVGKQALQSPQLQPQQTAESPQSSDGSAIINQMKFNRINCFYNQRKKLLSVTTHPPIQRQKQQFKQTLLKQRLLKNFSDCGINGIVTQCKATTAASCSSNLANNSGDIMRVYV